MSDTFENAATTRHFASYSGVKLPLKLITPLKADEVDGRTTYFSGYYDEKDNLMGLQKIVYSEVEFTHCYEYHDDGRIKFAEITIEDEEPQTMTFE